MERPQLSLYRLQTGVRSPNALNFTGSEYKTFPSNAEAIGYVYENPNPQVQLAPQIIAEGEWIIPVNKLVKVRDVSYEEAEKIDSDKGLVDMLSGKDDKAEQTPVEEMKSEIEEIKKTDIVGDVVRRSKGSVNGMLIGGGIGLLIGIVSRRNPLVMTVIGATIGGFLGAKNWVHIPKDLKEKETIKEEVVETEPQTA